MAALKPSFPFETWAILSRPASLNGRLINKGKANGKIIKAIAVLSTGSCQMAKSFRFGARWHFLIAPSEQFVARVAIFYIARFFAKFPFLVSADEAPDKSL